MFLGTVFIQRTLTTCLQLDGCGLGLLLALLETLLGLSRGDVSLAGVPLVDQELGVHLEGETGRW